MSRLQTLFARRYLVSPKSHSVINIISWVSAVAIGIPVAAMVILLSVFNGFEGLVQQMFTDFDPDIAITPREGKVFDAGAIDRARLLSLNEVAEVSYVLEDNALLEYRGRQFIGTVRGVDSSYRHVVPIDSMVSGGEYAPWFGDMMQALVGEGLAYNLGVNINMKDPIRAYVPRRGRFNPMVPVDSYRTETLWPGGRFMLDAETDGQYMITPIEFTRSLFDYPDGVSAAMVKLAPGVSEKSATAAIATVVGDGFRVQTRHQQKASLYSIMRYEKWGIFFIALMVMVIASFSIVGSLVMLIIEKRTDVRTIVAMGGSMGFIRGIFVREGMMVAGFGAAGGLLIGLAVCWAQQAFEIIKIPARTFLIDAYPVVVKPTDIVWIAVAFIAVNYIIIKFTTARMLPRSQVRI
ncbi:ABC transporter permease [Alistipes sp. OttesenSCG-928-B03]|nr:ABC transporter permease [Alistipes sp. OttesenSCG-928-B03]